MKIDRKWAMPNPDTFSIKPIREFIEKAFAEKIYGSKKICDPFVRNSPFKTICVSNDLDPDIEANFHLDALDFLRAQKTSSFDFVLFDPPYSPRQVSECYKKSGRTVNMQTTQASFWSNIKKEVSRIVKPGGCVLSFGWNSGGIGKKYGFHIDAVRIVAHGGWHNDTICVKEFRLK